MSKGGSRLGAGRPSYKVKGEQLQRVDVRVWARKGLLTGNRFFSWSWNRGGEPTGSIGVNVTPQSAVTLEYSLTQNGERRSISERVALIYKPCNFGGSRPWFQCPRCARQVAVLYMRSGRFGCRHCQRVSYSSQSEDEMARTWREQRRIEERLGEHWQRPKGMRLRTYDRLRDRLADCELRRDEAFCVAAARLLGERFTDRSRR
jgi:hypothetical protein